MRLWLHLSSFHSNFYPDSELKQQDRFQCYSIQNSGWLRCSGESFCLTGTHSIEPSQVNNHRSHLAWMESLRTDSKCSRVSNSWLVSYATYSSIHSKLSGSSLWAATDISNTYYILKGIRVHKAASYREKNGSVFRTAPNQLSNIDEAAWETLYPERE